MKSLALALFCALTRPAAAQAPAVGPGAVVGTQSSWQDLVRFSDQPNPLPYAAGLPFKAWQPAEKQVVLTQFAWVVQNQPGLWRRATAYGPLTAYRASRAPGIKILTLYTTITFMDTAFTDGRATPSKTYSVLHNFIHELVHVADIESALSSKPGWRTAVEAKLKDYNAQAPGLSSEADKEALADRLGLSSTYAGSSQLEALAELTAVVAMEKLLPPNHLAAVNIAGPVEDFVRREVLSAAGAGPDLGVELAKGALYRDANRPADAYAAYTRALQIDPTALVAYIRRAEVALKDGTLPKTAAADLAAARPLLPEHHNHAIIFYEVATESGLTSGRHAETLADCSEAATKGLESGALLMNCGRSRMMDSLSRGMRRQITPEERDRGYTAALAELRRAKKMNPSLAPKIDPIEKQLEGLLGTKTAA